MTLGHLLPVSVVMLLSPPAHSPSAIDQSQDVLSMWGCGLSPGTSIGIGLTQLKRRETVKFVGEEFKEEGLSEE